MGKKATISVVYRAMSGQVQVSSAIRRAQDCKAVLSDALIFLQTQDQLECPLNSVQLL
jgi:hypothetical protein